MNRFFTKQQAVAEYRLPVSLHVELFRAVQPVEQDDHGEALYLEDHLDRWLAERFGAGRVPASSNEPFMTIRETAAFLRCSYYEPTQPRRPQGQFKFKKGDAGYRFLEKLRESEKKKPT